MSLQRLSPLLRMRLLVFVVLFILLERTINLMLLLLLLQNSAWCSVPLFWSPDQFGQDLLGGLGGIGKHGLHVP